MCISFPRQLRSGIRPEASHWELGPSSWQLSKTIMGVAATPRKTCPTSYSRSLRKGNQFDRNGQFGDQIQDRCLRRRIVQAYFADYVPQPSARVTRQLWAVSPAPAGRRFLAGGTRTGHIVDAVGRGRPIIVDKPPTAFEQRCTSAGPLRTSSCRIGAPASRGGTIPPLDRYFRAREEVADGSCPPAG